MESGENVGLADPAVGSEPCGSISGRRCRTVGVPFHVIAFTEDVQAPPQDGEEMAAMMPNAEYHLLEGMGHGSWYGHAHDRINPYIAGLDRPPAGLM